jgi:biotin operon repressor
VNSTSNRPNNRPSKLGQQGVLLEALHLLIKGEHQSQVARELGISKTRLNYHVKHWLKRGFLIEDKRGKIVIYRPGPQRPDFLTWGEDERSGVRVHCLGLKFRHGHSEELLRERLKSFDEVPLRHWSRFVGDVVGLRVDVTSRHVIVWSSVVFDSSPVAALVRAFGACCFCATSFAGKFGLDIDPLHPELHGKKPHFAVVDPVAEVAADQVITSAKIGEVDASVGFGEIDFHDVRDLVAYLKMPRKIENIEALLEAVNNGYSYDRQTVHELVQAVGVYGKHLQSHTAIVKDLLSVVRILNSILDNESGIAQDRNIQNSFGFELPKKFQQLPWSYHILSQVRRMKRN